MNVQTVPAPAKPVAERNRDLQYDPSYRPPLL